MKIFLALCLSGIILFSALGYWTNRQLDKSNLDLPIKNLPKELNGLKILHLSDIHYGHLRLSQKQLLTEIKTEKPDLIFVTGDTIDRTDNLATSNIQALINDLVVLAPTFVVEGNHEGTSGQFDEWRQLMLTSEATLLENEVISLTIQGARINLIGLKNQVTSLKPEKLAAIKDKDINLMLAHHPELFEEYLTNFSPVKIHGVFSGHAHGGQIRLPKIGGLLAPNQGILPKYTDGSYSLDTYPESTLFVSRGLSNSSFPFRINNKPHLISIKLTQKK